MEKNNLDELNYKKEVLEKKYALKLVSLWLSGFLSAICLIGLFWGREGLMFVAISFVLVSLVIMVYSSNTNIAI